MTGNTNLTDLRVAEIEEDIDTLKSRTVKSKKISSGATIAANSYLSLTEASLAGKDFQGVIISGIASYHVYYTSAFIDNNGFTISLINKGSSNVTTGEIRVYYKD